jgi:cytochrome c nitrite reductase small subunit
MNLKAFPGKGIPVTVDDEKVSVAMKLILAVILGILIGVALFTFGYAKGASYLTDRPSACANCHVMKEQHDSWIKSGHGKNAVCNDCHTPPGLLAKYGTKAINGFFHSLAFTTGRYPDNILITPRNHRVTELACLKCHESIVDGINQTRVHGLKVQCIHCHRRVGHL